MNVRPDVPLSRTIVSTSAFVFFCRHRACTVWIPKRYDSSSLAATASLQSTYTADTDGDGEPDIVTVLTTGIQVFHPATGRTSLYPYPASEGSFSLSSLDDTDGVAGVDLIVIWAGPAGFGTNGIDVIYDRIRGTNRYSEDRSFSVNTVVDTDGQAR